MMRVREDLERAGEAGGSVTQPSVAPLDDPLKGPQTLRRIHAILETAEPMKAKDDPRHFAFCTDRARL